MVGSVLMDNSLSREATDWREGRRLRAFELNQEGCSQQRIAQALGVSYHPAHLSRVLKALTQSLHKPQRRANQREEEAVRRCKEERWPSLTPFPQKGALKEGRTIVFADQPG